VPLTTVSISGSGRGLCTPDRATVYLTLAAKRRPSKRVALFAQATSCSDCAGDGGSNRWRQLLVRMSRLTTAYVNAPNVLQMRQNISRKGQGNLKMVV
jgi:hypothetical protein